MFRITRLVAIFVVSLGFVTACGTPTLAQDHRGHQMASCGATPTPGTPAAEHRGHDMTDDGTPTPVSGMPFDLAYIDMMIPHHDSVIALAGTALPMLTDQRLIDMANSIVTSQQGEIETLRQLRDTNFPGAVSMDYTDHEMLHSTFPGLLTWDYPMEQWDALMDADALVSRFCGMDNPDLAFVQLVIPHHEMAILVSQDALTAATLPEIVAIAADVITAQQAEVDTLRQVEADLA